MDDREETRLSLLLSSRVRSCCTLSINYTIIIFFVIQAVSPLCVFLRDNLYLRAVSCSLLGHKSFFMEKNKCHVICVLLFFTPWMTPIKMSKYTLTWARAAPWRRLIMFSGVLWCFCVAMRAYKGWVGDLYSWVSVFWTLSLTVSVMVQNKAMDLIHPMVMGRWNLMRCSSVEEALRTRKAT